MRMACSRIRLSVINQDASPALENSLHCGQDALSSEGGALGNTQIEVDRERVPCQLFKFVQALLPRIADAPTPPVVAAHVGLR
jgi:hypothetical protein